VSKLMRELNEHLTYEYVSMRKSMCEFIPPNK